ncbi:MAG: hypothetical protein WAV46_03210 [Candidatus Moraniibacteriota bacterium]
MRLKILIVPFFLVMALILSIGYIKPDFDAILAKKAEIAAQDEMLANVDSVLNNIRTLNSSLDRDAAAENFVLRYLPYTLNQDQTIDAFNYLAAQSGLIITGMDLKQPPVLVSVEVAANGSPLAAGAPEAQTFVFTGNVTGSYENIKAFFDRLAHVDRFQKIQSFSLQKNEETVAATKESGNTADLKGTFVTAYGYLPKKPVASALHVPVFLSPELHFSDIAALQAQITNLSTLEKGPAGKPNPFQ